MNIAIVDDDEKERYKIEHEVKYYISAHHLNIGCRVYSGGKAFLEDAEINLFFWSLWIYLWMIWMELKLSVS